ncbi:PH, RCC1 and FYVE domains-containing protein 1-like isoform X3 [Macadamia integrifolia]|uniref:PH, RCC1 and FYVE domains-containing protein 1-like isoform X3 n=1 Tax=Macadamia integrifolia TaxID=60698 RepID=UPI001C4FC9E4|nr:PH, RCC1 and FYVE domains-containing protein 1-like isoform X3 [Macadamia integrifolia]
MAGDETAKCKAAKEVIKSLTAQLKEMAERVPEGSTASSKLGSTARRTASIPISVMNESHLSSLNSPQLASNGLSINPVSCNGANSQTNPAEWVVQDEPGVYLTLNSLPGGGKELRRVRFSRKHFTEKQAEKWWVENRVNVHQRHDIRSTEK